MLFEEEAARLRVVLDRWLVGAVEHVGSTAVPGLAAKPILDMLAGVSDLDEARHAVSGLADLGYMQANHRPHEALWFYKQDSEDYTTRTHQLHLTRPDSALWCERVAFRDALRASSQLLAQYEDLKRGMASRTLVEYTAGKREFVAGVLLRAGVGLG